MAHLLDTGAPVSLLDRSQTHHLKCRRAFADWTGPVVSTEAVALAEELDCTSVFTTDRADFSVDRIKGRKPFRILPSD